MTSLLVPVKLEGEEILEEARGGRDGILIFSREHSFLSEEKKGRKARKKKEKKRPGKER